MRIELKDPELRKRYDKVTKFLKKELGSGNYTMFGQLNVFDRGTKDEEFLFSFGVFNADESQKLSAMIANREHLGNAIDAETNKIIRDL